jgi:hypothetical protein
VIVRGFVHRLCKALCPDLILGRRIWRGVRRSPVPCGVGSVALCTGAEECKKIERLIKKKKSWWT